MTKKPTLLAQLITDKLQAKYPDIAPWLVDDILKERDKIAGERSKNTNMMSSPRVFRGKRE